MQRRSNLVPKNLTPHASLIGVVLAVGAAGLNSCGEDETPKPACFSPHFESEPHCESLSKEECLETLEWNDTVWWAESTNCSDACVVCTSVCGGCLVPEDAEELSRCYDLEDPSTIYVNGHASCDACATEGACQQLPSGDWVVCADEVWTNDFEYWCG